MTAFDFRGGGVQQDLSRATCLDICKGVIWWRAVSRYDHNGHSVAMSRLWRCPQSQVVASTDHCTVESWCKVSAKLSLLDYLTTALSRTWTVGWSKRRIKQISSPELVCIVCRLGYGHFWTLFENVKRTIIPIQETSVTYFSYQRRWIWSYPGTDTFLPLVYIDWNSHTLQQIVHICSCFAHACDAEHSYLYGKMSVYTFNMLAYT